MANINETISEIKKLNPELARQVEKYVKDHSYGLVFEQNLPEAVRLYTKKVAVGDTVNIRPDRYCVETEEHKVSWLVKSIKDNVAIIEKEGETREIPTEDLVTIVSYKDTIYPGLKEIDRIERGNPDDPYHMVINSENYHALEALIYAYAGKVDCIYIDPPYNKEKSKDWKYNCNYVDVTDKYKHSKWLAFMQRRLDLASKLLNPDGSVLIVTIDEVEYLNLGLLLNQMFPTARIQMISTVIKPEGTSRANEFSRTNEFIYFVMLGNIKINNSSTTMFEINNKSNSNDVEDVDEDTSSDAIEWRNLRRRESNSIRDIQHPNQFYPFFIDKNTGYISSIGKPLPFGVDKSTVIAPEGTYALFPLTPKGVEMMWGKKYDSVIPMFEKGYLRVDNGKDPKKAVVKYLSKGTVEDIDNGKITISGYGEQNEIIGSYENSKQVLPKTIWYLPTHNSQAHGSVLLKKIIGENDFPYPKSLYAVRDALRFFVADKPDALIIDFFAGSGTTVHAVNLLNAEDGGHRRCICITNNELRPSEEENYTQNGYRPGDDEWEKHGIAKFITWRRTKYSIEGVDFKGEPLKDEYVDAKYSDGNTIKMSDGFKANAIFCELTYESDWNIRLDQAFNAIAPILWMVAGCKGEIIKKMGKSYITTDNYGVLFDYGQASKFCEKIKSTPSIKTAFVVTDDQRRYSNICRRLPDVKVHRLYESFLKTFEICGEGGLD